jgi:hypothetical protein
MIRVKNPVKKFHDDSDIFTSDLNQAKNMTAATEIDCEKYDSTSVK